MIFDINGVLAPVFTPVTDAGCVNVDVIPEYVKYLHDHGVKGILVGGTTGEAVLLSRDERKHLLDAWLQSTRPLGMKVISQVGGVPLPDVIELAKYAEKMQVDAIMTLPELYYKPKTIEQLVSYLETVSRAAPSIPLVYYHFPMMSGVDVNMAQFFSTASSRIPSFKGMKADLGVAVQVTDKLSKDQRVFIANHHLAPAAVMGYDSSIATVTNMFPDLVRDIVDTVKSGEVYRAREMQETMNRLVEGVASQGDFVPSMKVAMELVTGIRVGPPRQPLTPLDQEHRKNVEENLTKLGLELRK